MENFQTVRGVKDLLPEELGKMRFIEQQAALVCKNACYEEISVPIFEFAELFEKPLGETSDIVTKENYVFQDRSNNTLMLRPEGTTGVVRAAINESLLQDFPKRFFYYGPMFRYERPQKGRLRQFHQFGVELLGVKDYFADIETIYLAKCFLKKIDVLSQTILKINSLGDYESRENYKIKLKSFLKKYINDLSSESKTRLENNPLRILDSKNEEDVEISLSSPKIYEYLTDEAKKHYEDLKRSLNILEIDFEENANLVRGLDYYCNTVFEYKSDNLGSQDTLLGGGRYDGLIKVLGGPDIPGIGWAAGIERIALLMESEKKISSTIHIAVTNEKFTDYFLYLQKYLSENRISYYWNYKYNLKKSFTKANTSSASYIIIIGENEFNGNFFTIKNLITSEQKQLKLNQIFNHLNDKSR